MKKITITSSYYGRMRSKDYSHLKPNGIAISNGRKYWDSKVYLPLAPSWELLTSTVNELPITDIVNYSEFRSRYYSEVLDKLDPKEVLEDLLKLSPSPILLCHESAKSCIDSKQFCHRHIVLQWLKDGNPDIEVLELGI